MKALIVKWQDTNKYVLHVKSNNDLLLERKKQEHEHLHPKIVSWDEWEVIQACQWFIKYKTTALKVMKVRYWYLCCTLPTLLQGQNIFYNYTIQESWMREPKDLIILLLLGIILAFVWNLEIYLVWATQWMTRYSIGSKPKVKHWDIQEKY